MKKLKNGIIIAICFVFIGGAFSFAENSGDSSHLRGREIVEIGKISTIEGTLKMEGTEWVLLTSDINYDIHLGPEAYRESRGFKLVEGNRAVVKGFLHNSDMAVMEIESNGALIVLRDASGMPAWAGSRFARGENRSSDDNHDDHDHQNTPRKDAPEDLESLDNLGSF